MDRAYFVYIICDKAYGTLYVGVTNDIARRVYEHREGLIKGFSKKHGLKILVYYEMHTEIEEAIKREKQIKRWKRDWKINLIHQNNRDWRDLYEELNN